MKKVKIFLGATALVLAVSGAFAFKTSAKFGLGNLYYLNDEVCTLDTNCAYDAAGTGTPCNTSVTFYQTRTGSTCSNPVTSAHTNISE